MVLKDLILQSLAQVAFQSFIPWGIVACLKHLRDKLLLLAETLRLYIA